MGQSQQQTNMVEMWEKVNTVEPVVCQSWGRWIWMSFHVVVCQETCVCTHVCARYYSSLEQHIFMWHVSSDTKQLRNKTKQEWCLLCDKAGVVFAVWQHIYWTKAASCSQDSGLVEMVCRFDFSYTCYEVKTAAVTWGDSELSTPSHSQNRVETSERAPPRGQSQSVGLDGFGFVLSSTLASGKLVAIDIILQLWDEKEK